jgi:hypothetical protein
MLYIYTVLAVILVGTTNSAAFATDRRIDGWDQFKAGMSEDDMKKLLGASDNSADAKDQPDSRELTYPGRIRIGNDTYNLNISFYREKAFKFQFSHTGQLSTLAECVGMGEALADSFTTLYGKPDGTIANIQEKHINSSWVYSDGSVVSVSTAWSNENCNHSIVLKFPSYRAQLSPVILPRQ